MKDTFEMKCINFTIKPNCVQHLKYAILADYRKYVLQMLTQVATSANSIMCYSFLSSVNSYFG